MNAFTAAVLFQCLASPCVVCAYQLTLALYCTITMFTWPVLRCLVTVYYMDNEWSVSERDLLSQHHEQANALATWTGRRLVCEVLG